MARRVRIVTEHHPGDGLLSACGLFSVLTSLRVAHAVLYFALCAVIVHVTALPRWPPSLRLASRLPDTLLAPYGLKSGKF